MLTRVVLFLLGAITSILAAMCGIGGGLFAVPILHYGLHMPLKQSIGTGLGMVASVAFAATATEVLHDGGALEWRVVACLLAGSLVGTQIGFRVAQKLDARRMKMIFAVVLVGAGLRILFMDGGTASNTTAPFDPTLTDFALISLIGLGGGFVAPLLGIGGGLVAVPSLFLGFPQLGYLGARACSLAMGAVTSSRSLWLYWRQGKVHIERAAWLGAGALLGATLGVKLVHLDGADEVARVLMGCVLWVVAVRFVFDVVRARPEAAEQE